MSYKGLIIEIQKVIAKYERLNYEIDNPEIYEMCNKDYLKCIRQEFIDDLDNILKSEEYMMKKTFKL